MENGRDGMTSAAICIEHLSVRFSGKPVLDDISVAIEPGGPTFLLGRSGSGKTTLLRAINRLNECFPGCETQGRIGVQLGGEHVNVYGRGIAAETLRRRIGMVFQNPNVLPLSIARNIALPLEATRSLSASESQDRIEQALRDVYLWDEVRDRLSAPAASLSGGQQQRLCLARALALQPEILLLDEPTASLDFRAARQIEDLLAELKTRYTLVVVSHSLGQAMRLAEHVFVLHDGNRIEALPPDVFRSRDALFAAMDDLI
ncbi:phosphate ABC transporter ATP-binding protein [Oxalobacter sp. OttesenSCG-928-P03]|nr:phosphate ABC transporter ATP-binding protein [Oxalobacter sp. OttesenSCG-928-P03]